MCNLWWVMYCLTAYMPTFNKSLDLPYWPPNLPNLPSFNWAFMSFSLEFISNLSQTSKVFFYVIVISNLFTHVTLLERSSKNLLKCVWACIPDQGRIWKCWFLKRGENRLVPGEKPLEQEKEIATNWSQPTYSVDTGIQTWATFGGRRVLLPLCQPCS